uniref:Uncharacterized protein n=1 Tax=Romanomermis culicivorax TaxID=13658 RepID=A0A915K9N0_ROMCU
MNFVPTKHMIAIDQKTLKNAFFWCMENVSFTKVSLPNFSSFSEMVAGSFSVLSGQDPHPKILSLCSQLIGRHIYASLFQQNGTAHRQLEPFSSNAGE